MRTIITTWVAVIATLFPTLAMGALPPTRVSGQSDALSTTFDLKTPYSQATKYSGTGSLLELDSYNVLKNPRFEATTYSSNWTASGGTVAAAATTNIFFSKGATWDSGSASQTFTSDAITVPEGFKGNNCEASMYIKVPSGTAAHLIQAWDGTNILASASVVNSVYFTKNTVTFPCPTSGTIALRLISVASDEPLIALDEGYLGLARNVGVADLITEWEAWTPSSSWTGTITYTGFKRRVGTNQEIKFRIATGGAPTGSALTLNIPSECVIDTAKVTGNNARNALGNLLIFDSDTGANIYGTIHGNNTTSVALNVILTGNASTAPIGQIGATTPITFANGDTIDGYFSVPCVGWAASTVVMPDAQGWFAAGYISGANPAMGSLAVTSYAEIANGSLSLTANSGSASVGIACSSTNSSTVGSSTCSAGNEIVGITTNIPRSGVYEACFQFGHVINIGGTAGGSLTAAFQVVETANASGTITTEGGGRVTSGAGYEGGSKSPTQVNPVMVCGTFNVSAGQKLFKVYYEQAIPSGTIFTNEIQADASAAVGQRNIYFIVRPVNSQQQAILANSVSTQVTNGARIIWASVKSICSSSPCSIGSQSGDFTSITRSGTGVYQANFNAGTFSGTPVCTCSTVGALDGTCSAYGSTTSISTVRTYTPAGASQDGYIEMMCIGPR